MPHQFQVEAPKRLKRGDEWDWRTLTRALMYATSLFEDDGAKKALLYLKRTFPKEFSVSGLAPLASEALAEIVNLWGACYRRLGEPESAIELFDTALRLTKRESIRQLAHYNRGYTRLENPGWGSSERAVFKQLNLAKQDLTAATSLCPTDAAAWPKLGTVALLLGNRSLLVRKRISYYELSCRAYDHALILETDDGERASIEDSLTISRRGLEKLSRLGWLRRRYGWSSVVPGDHDENASDSALADNYGHTWGAPTHEHFDDASEQPDLAAVLDLVATADQLVNQPTEENDDGRRERNPHTVAERIIRAFDGRSGERAGKPAFAFVEAAWFLLQSGTPLPELRTRRMQSLTELTTATHARDGAAAMALLEQSLDKKWHGWLWPHVDGLVGRQFPVALAKFCLQYGLSAAASHMEALGAQARELSHKLIVSIKDRRAQVALTLAALLSAMDSGGDTSQLDKHWSSLRPANLEEDAIWASGEVRRLSRTDLSAA